MTNGLKAFALGVAALVWTAGAEAAGTAEPTVTVDAATLYEEGVAAAEAEDWTEAVLLFSEAASLDPESADALNMLAYSQRHLGDVDTAIRNYNLALALDPDHEGAREYLGEALLTIGDLDGAKQQLEALRGICPEGCEALEELHEAIEAFEAANS